MSMCTTCLGALDEQIWISRSGSADLEDLEHGSACAQLAWVRYNLHDPQSWGGCGRIRGPMRQLLLRKAC